VIFMPTVAIALQTTADPSGVMIESCWHVGTVIASDDEDAADGVTAGLSVAVAVAVGLANTGTAGMEIAGTEIVGTELTGAVDVGVASGA
jgi:hypothetical protein